MAAYSHRRSSGPVLRPASLSGGLSRHSSAPTQPPPRPCSISSGGPNSTTQVSNIHRYTSPSLRYSVDRPSGSSNRSAPPRRSCMCSPTNHPGSFRCSLHKAGRLGNSSGPETASSGRSPSSTLSMRRSAMNNSLVRIGTVEGDLVRRALTALIRPSSHNQLRRGEFRQRPSRLSAMSAA